MIRLILLFSFISFGANATCWRCELPKPIIVEENTFIEQSIKNEVNRPQYATLGASTSHQVYWGNNHWKLSFKGAYQEDSLAGGILLGKRFNDNILHFTYSIEDETSEELYTIGFSMDLK